MRDYLFDDWHSVIHAVFGFTVRFVPVWLRPVIIIVYVLYEVMEEENAVSTVGDVVEFLVGYVIADVVVG